MRSTLPFIFGILGGIALFGMWPKAQIATPSLSLSASVAKQTSTDGEISTSSTLLASTTPQQKISLPILVYHIVRPSYASDSHAVRAIALTPKVFDAEMSYLKDAGYTIVRFSDLEAYFYRDVPLPSHPIILSFDDGWRDQFLYAFPILEKDHDPAEFFIFTNAVGHKDFMTWDDLHALVTAGMTIGDHSKSHPYLTRLAPGDTLQDEIVESKQILESHLGIQVHEFAYPFGLYNPAIVEAVRNAGYLSARSDSWGSKQSADRLYILNAINAPTTTEQFEHLFPHY